jgi:uncharacterized protein YndB with AHSA1/START domain
MSDSRVKMESLGDSALKAEIEIKAAPEKVYAAWTEVEQFPKWFGPRANGHLQIDQFDCSVGGRYDVTMVFDDGDRFQMVGHFHELDPPKKVVLTWQGMASSMGPDETLITVDLTPTGAGTLLTLTHERFATVAVRDEHQQGWAPLLDRLANILAE